MALPDGPSDCVTTHRLCQEPRDTGQEEDGLGQREGNLGNDLKFELKVREPN